MGCVSVLLEDTVIEEVVKLNKLDVGGHTVSVSFDSNARLADDLVDDFDDCLADLDATLNEFDALTVRKSVKVTLPSYIPRASRAALQVAPSEPSTPDPYSTQKSVAFIPPKKYPVMSSSDPTPVSSPGHFSPSPSPSPSPYSSPPPTRTPAPMTASSGQVQILPPPLPARDSPVQFHRTGSWASQPSGPARTGHPVPLQMLHVTIFVTNVDPNLKVQTLINFFGFCGAIKQYAFSRATCSALIYFNSREAVELAKQLDKLQLGNKVLNVESVSLYDTHPHIPYVAELLPYLTPPTAEDLEPVTVSLYSPSVATSQPGSPLTVSNSLKQSNSVSFATSVTCIHPATSTSENRSNSAASNSAPVTPTTSASSTSEKKERPQKPKTKCPSPKNTPLNLDEFEEIKL
eukprot:TRINITY_DN6478_c0_g1_i1.p1 TRINITY_DN6478_c0_g1~~TRINITY_DN6478_c0_g1_i1.p1  ORF type:complete len:444 (+),score=83.82 TRINITY_DN6478_c0_g1_i1:122-1333(+)